MSVHDRGKVVFSPNSPLSLSRTLTLSNCRTKFHHNKKHAPNTMKFSFSFVAAMALPMVSGAYNPHLDHFDISFNRFQSDKCQSQSLEHGDGATIHQEKCHHWDDGQTFDSFTFTYFADKYWSPDELPTDRDCAVLIYEYDHCGGRLLLDRDQVRRCALLMPPPFITLTLRSRRTFRKTWESVGGCMV